MKDKLPGNAGILSAIAAVLIIVVIYTMLGTVDLVYMQGNKEISRQENVSVFSDIELPEGEFSYSVNGETKELEDINTLKTDIGITVITNLFSFKWQKMDNIIVLTAEQ